MTVQDRWLVVTDNNGTLALDCVDGTVHPFTLPPSVVRDRNDWCDMSTAGNMVSVLIEGAVCVYRMDAMTGAPVFIRLITLDPRLVPAFTLCCLGTCYAMFDHSRVLYVRQLATNDVVRTIQMPAIDLEDVEGLYECSGYIIIQLYQRLAWRSCYAFRISDGHISDAAFNWRTITSVVCRKGILSNSIQCVDLNTGVCSLTADKNAFRMQVQDTSSGLAVWADARPPHKFYLSNMSTLPSIEWRSSIDQFRYGIILWAEPSGKTITIIKTYSL